MNGEEFQEGNTNRKTQKPKEEEASGKIKIKIDVLREKSDVLRFQMPHH